MATPKPRFDGPIPGENYTSDVKNYPWHRPPDIVDYDEATEYVLSDISNPSKMSMIFSLLEAGSSVSGVVTVINLLNISNGKYAVDTSLLIAGPVARYIDIMAKKNGVEAKMGTPEEKIYTVEMFEAIAGMGADEDGDSNTDTPEAPVQTAEAPQGGLMGVTPQPSNETAPAGVQSAMLGYSDDEEEEA
jgi:hypothetical protein